MFKRDFNDHQLATYLRNERVIDNFLTFDSPSINEYWRETQLIAVVVFDNAKCERVVYTYNTKN